MPKRLAILLLSIGITGCSAKLVSAPGAKSGSAYAPVNEQSLPGVVRYSAKGIKPVVNSRREAAYKKMFETCNGKYKILGESFDSEGGVIVPVGNLAAYSPRRYVYIHFECVN